MHNWYSLMYIELARDVKTCKSTHGLYGLSHRKRKLDLQSFDKSDALRILIELVLGASQQHILCQIIFEIRVELLVGQ